MADILQDFPIKASVESVFLAVSTAKGLDSWWTKRAAGEPKLGATYELFFGPTYEWRATVTKCVSNSEFELEIVHADEDWTGTRVGFVLEPREEVTWVRFYNIGWPSPNEHYRVSTHCWAMYLRLLRKFLEDGTTVPYETRFDA